MDQYPSLYVPNGKGGHAHMKFKDKDARTRYMLDMQKRSNPGAHRKSLKRIEQHRAANGQEPLYSGRLSKAQGFDYGKYTGDQARGRGEPTLIPDRMYQKYAAKADSKTKNQITSASIIGGAAGGVGGGFLGADQAKWHKNRGTKPKVNPKIAAPVAGAAIGASALGLLAGKNHMANQRKLKEPAHRRRFDNAVIGAMTRLENAERFKAQRAPSGVAKADSGTWPQPVPAGSLSAMTTLAELGVIAKAQSKQQFHDPHESHGGRKMFAGGLAASGVGGALVNSGMKAAYRDNKYLTQDDAGQIFRRGSDGMKRPISSMQIKGAKRAIGGSTLGVLGGTALSAAPIVGGVNMWNKHKRRKAFNAQQAGGAA